MLALNQRKQFLLPIVRIFFIAFICWFLAQAIIAGQSTLGALLWSLAPAGVVGLTFVAVEFFMREGISLSLFFNIGKVSFKTWFFLFAVSMVIGVVVMSLSIRSPVDLVMIIIIVTAMVASIIYMIQNSGVNAICAFILAWPFMVFERSYGNVVFNWTRTFNNLDLGFGTTDIMMFFYVLLLLSVWIIRKVIEKEHFERESRTLGVWLFIAAGLLSLIIVPDLQMERLSPFIRVILLPVLVFILFVNEIKSWRDVRKIFTISMISIIMLTAVYIYFTFYRYAVADPTSVQSLAGTRGGGGTFLGSRYVGYRGFLLEYIIPLLLPYIVFLITVTIRRSIKVTYIALVLLLLSVQVYTFGRGAWIATALCFLPLMWGSSRGRLISLLLIICIVIGVAYIPILYEFLGIVFKRFDTLISLEGIRSETRYNIIIASGRMFLDHPWTGVGSHLFGNVSTEYGLSYSIFDIAQNEVVHGSWSHAHSTLFHMIAELGIWGLIAWGTILWIPIRSLIQPNLSTTSDENAFRRAWQGIILVFISYFFIINSLGYWWIEEPIVILLMLILAVCRISGKLDASKTNKGKLYADN